MGYAYEHNGSGKAAAGEPPVRTLHDLSLVAGLLLAPIIATEIYFAAADNDYVRRNIAVEIGSRFAGNVYTGEMGCARAAGFQGRVACLERARCAVVPDAADAALLGRRVDGWGGRLQKPSVGRALNNALSG